MDQFPRTRGPRPHTLPIQRTVPLTLIAAPDPTVEPPFTGRTVTEN